MTEERGTVPQVVQLPRRAARSGARQLFEPAQLRELRRREKLLEQENRRLVGVPRD
jgi:hypothetical protein